MADELTPAEELRTAAEKLNGPPDGWIKWVHPDLKAPLAGVLDEQAARYDLHVSSMLCHYDHGDACKGHLRPVCGNCASWVDADEYRCTCWDNALTVARLINGGEA